jgi:succinyl-diaminopimelate desuccinylase
VTVPSQSPTIPEADVQDLLADLVARPSVNPLHLEQVSAPYGEAAVADYVEQFGCALGLPVERQPVLPGRDNVLITLAGSVPDRRWLWECHMDTVPGWDGQPGPFTPRILDGRLYGRGACDVKGTLAAMLAALRWLVRRGPPQQTIILAATVDEEHRARGIRALVPSLPPIRGAIVGEPTQLTLAIAHKGCVRWRIHTRGRSVHSSQAALGVNAIDAMVDLLAGLRSELTPLGGGRHHELVGEASLAVCTIHGGVAVNVIPDECVVEVDRRTIPGEEPAAVDAELRAAVERVVARHPGLRVEVEPPFVAEPALGTPPEAAVVQALAAAATRVLGRAPLLGVPFGTDAGALAEVGIPTVVFGPGSIDLAHTTEESVALADVARAAEILALLADQ